MEQEQNTQTQEPIIKESKKNIIPTRLGSLVVLLAATLAGAGVWWYADSYTPPEVVGVSEMVEQIKERREEVIQVISPEEEIIGAVLTKKINVESLCSDPNSKEGGWNTEINSDTGEWLKTCSIGNKIEVRVSLENKYVYNKERPFYIITITDGDKVVGSHEAVFNEEPVVQADILNFNTKKLLLIYWGISSGANEYFLYVINEDRKIKPVKDLEGEELSWWRCQDYRWNACQENLPYLEIKYGIEYKNNLYLRIGEEVWSIGEDDVLKDKIYTTAIIEKNGNLYFKNDTGFCYDFIYNSEWRHGENGYDLYPIGGIGCVDGYLLIDPLTKNEEKNSEFKNEYLKTAIKYDEILKDERWGDVRWKVMHAAPCVPGESEILMGDRSYKQIESIKKGDEVASFDFKNRTIKKSTVIENIKRTDPILTINKTFTFSLDHPVFTNGEFKEAQDVIVGEFLLNEKGEEIEVRSTNHPSPNLVVDTYDLELDKYRNFFAHGILVQGLLPEVDDWLSPLIVRTLNYIFAGEEEQAWKTFEEDFTKLFRKYPVENIEEKDFQRIKAEIQRKLTGEKPVYLGTCSVEVKEIQEIERLPSEVILPDSLEGLDYGVLIVNNELCKKINRKDGVGLLPYYQVPRICGRTGVASDSPADKANISAGDIILKIDGEIIIEDDDIDKILVLHYSGDKINLKILRDGEIEEVVVELEERPED